jgi:phosphoribosylformylglycinamidine (FGAM) synthase-like amidotransferase family enzyme
MKTAKPNFLVYVEHPMCSLDCADAVFDVLNMSGKYSAKLVGPSSFPYLILSNSTLEQADCLVVPGGLGDADQYDDSFLRTLSPLIKSYLANGGRYMGICAGGYFAGHHYMDILRPSTKAAQYVRRKKSTVNHEDHDVVTVNWDKEERTVYFHDGAAFVPRRWYHRVSGEVVARYKNGDAAALIQKYKNGKVGVMGPHPEAQKWWFYSQSRITKRWRDCVQHDLLLSFAEKLINA